MKNKINKCINDSYEGYGCFSSSVAIHLLDELFKEETLSFISFLRENYSTRERWENEPLDENTWRCFDTDKEFTTEEVLNKFLEDGK